MHVNTFIHYVTKQPLKSCMRLRSRLLPTPGLVSGCAIALAGRLSGWVGKRVDGFVREGCETGGRCLSR